MAAVVGIISNIVLIYSMRNGQRKNDKLIRKEEERQRQRNGENRNRENERKRKRQRGFVGGTAEK